jgi:hypothetical protein
VRSAAHRAARRRAAVMRATGAPAGGGHPQPGNLPG